MKIAMTVGMLALIGGLAVTPVFAADANQSTNNGTDNSANTGAAPGGASSNGAGGIQATTPNGGQVTNAGGGQCYLKTKSGKEVIITCPAGLDLNQ